MMRLVQEETAKNPDTAFASAMRPAIFMFISIAIGTIIAPLSVGQIKELMASQAGVFIAQSWFALLFFRIVSFSLFALAGAALADALTPGAMTRDSMRSPFYQQCYICSPLALIASPTLVDLGPGISPVVLTAFAAILVWFLACQYLFFRRFVGLGIVASVLLAPAVFMIGAAGLVVLSLSLLYR